MSTPDTMARDVILKKLRNALSNPETLFRHPEPTNSASNTPSAVTSEDGSGRTLAMSFGENLTEVLGSYELVEHPADIPQRISEQIKRWRKDTGGDAEYGSEVLSWAPNALPIPDLDSHLRQLGVSLFVPSELSDEAERTRSASQAVGLTGVDAAFAGTGSMVLIPGPRKSRAASLLPLHHIALVPISRIHPTFESWLAGLRKQDKLEGLVRQHAQLAFITGPSKSADIELNLTLGVHGPRDVHAIVFDDGE